MKITYIVNMENKTIKQILKENIKVSDKLLSFLKKNQLITYNNNKIININQITNIGDNINIDLSFKESSDNIISTKMNLNILYEDESMIVVNKPVGIPIHPSIEHYTDSLSNGIKYYFDSIGLKKKIRPVIRLDKNTSGITIFAKNQYIQECLIHQMQTKEFKKNYLAVVKGNLEKLEGVINAPIKRKENSIIERCVSGSGEKAITHYKVLEQNTEKNYDLVQCILETGRTHQIRVHFAYIGHPLLGDSLYGSASPYISRQALHAYKVEFIHPISNRTITITANIPDDMKIFFNSEYIS